MLELDRPVYDGIVKHAYDGGAEEICGLLGGRYDTGVSVATRFEAADNVADTPEIRYAIDPAEQLTLTERIESAGDDVVGFYHSHPAGPTEPSDTDAARATWPDHSYVIVALNGYPYVGSWRWTGEQFEQERLRLPDRR